MMFKKLGCDMEDETKSDKLILTQANALAMSAQKMTLQEKRLLLLIISKVRMSDNEFKTYYIPISSITEYLKLNDRSIYLEIKSISKKLLSRVLEIEINKGEWKQFQWVSSSEYKKKENSPIGLACLEIELHKKLHPFLLNLKKKFGSIPLQQIATMRSINSIRLLEIIYFQSRSVNKKEIYFDVNDLKKRLGIEGMYKNFASFRCDILERAKKECLEKSPITFTYNLKKSGRKVIGLYFHIEKNSNKKTIELPPGLKDSFPLSQPEDQKEPQITQIPEEHDQLFKRITFIGISESRANNDILKDAERAIKAIEVAEGYLEKEDSDPRKIYSKAYSENWSKKSQHQIEKEEKRKAYKTAEERKEAKKNFENQYIKYKEESIENVRKNLSSDKLKILESQAMQVGKQKKKENTFGSVETYTRFELNSLLEKEINISTQDEWVENKMKAWEEKKNEKSSE